METAFASVVEALPDSDLKENLTRRSAACVARLVRYEAKDACTLHTRTCRHSLTRASTQLSGLDTEKNPQAKEIVFLSELNIS